MSRGAAPVMIAAMSDVTGAEPRCRAVARPWRRILIVNAIAALASFGLLGGLVTTTPWPRLWRTVVDCAIYANCVGTMLSFVMPRLSVACAGGSAARRRALKFAAVPLVIVFGCAVASAIVIGVGLAPSGTFLQYFKGSLWVALVVGIIASLTVTAYEGLRSRLEDTSLALRTKELDEERARKLAIQAQLASLESRVQPHFLFNTLNSIAALVHDDPEAAERVIGQLATLLRSALDTASLPLTPLDQELRIVGDYLAIERVRFGERLRYRVDAPPELLPVLVPTLALQTIVENSVKYGVAPRRDGATITITAAAADGRLRLDVEDDGPGFDGAHLPDGHGLALVRDRLAMAFGDRAALHIDGRPGRARVSIELPIERADPSAGHALQGVPFVGPV
jgi:two-component system sensor histidine kinase AlgZ